MIPHYEMKAGQTEERLAQVALDRYSPGRSYTPAVAKIVLVAIINSTDGQTRWS